MTELAAGQPPKTRCRRCLLAEIAGSEDIVAAVGRARELIPKSDLCPDELYRKRLSVCRECDHLDSATCLRCGCYVEIRALRLGAKCPAGKKKW